MAMTKAPSSGRRHRISQSGEDLPLLRLGLGLRLERELRLDFWLRLRTEIL